jgi:capsule polysaccharide export protein KpsC/LpsZ
MTQPTSYMQYCRYCNFYYKFVTSFAVISILLQFTPCKYLEKITTFYLGFELSWVTPDDDRYRSKHVAC